MSPDERWDQSWYQTDTLARSTLAPWSKKDFREGAFIPGFKRRPQTAEEMKAEFNSYRMAQKSAALNRQKRSESMMAAREKARQRAAERRQRRKDNT